MRAQASALEVLREGPPAWLRPLASLLEWPFRAGVRLRGALYDRGILRAHRVERPVLSVGNLAVGGVGKTPFVVLLAERLAARGLAVAVLSRGYGARAPVKDALIVSRGEGPLVGAEAAGDEPVLIARRTRAAVVVAPRRILAARAAIALGADVLLLDDGFQHRALARDLDLVLLDAAEPFANGRLLPAGPLREPPSALLRAHLAVFVESEGAHERPRPPLPISTIRVRVVPSSAGPALAPASDRAAPETLRGRRVALFAAIARPARFEAMVRALGAEVIAAHFHRDHTFVDDAELHRFHRAAAAAGAEVVLTTEKDAARLGPDRARLFHTLAIEHRLADTSDAEVLDRALEVALAKGAR